MEIVKRDFPEIMLDNEDAYFKHLVGVIESVDELSSVEIVKTSHSYNIRIAPCLPKYLQPLLHEILKYNNLLGIHLELGKSMKLSSSLTFNIEI